MHLQEKVFKIQYWKQSEMKNGIKNRSISEVDQSKLTMC